MGRKIGLKSQRGGVLVRRDPSPSEVDSWSDLLFGFGYAVLPALLGSCFHQEEGSVLEVEVVGLSGGVVSYPEASSSSEGEGGDPVLASVVVVVIAVP